MLFNLSVLLIKANIKYLEYLNFQDRKYQIFISQWTDYIIIKIIKLVKNQSRIYKIDFLKYYKTFDNKSILVLYIIIFLIK